MNNTSYFQYILNSLWQLKLRFQFSGWLQYMPSLFLSIGCFVFEYIFRTVGGKLPTIYSVLLGEVVPFCISVAAKLLFVNFCYEIITFKLHIRLTPPEKSSPRRLDKLSMFDVMKLRRSCRSFQRRKLEHSDLTELLDYVNTQTSAAARCLSPEKPIKFEYVDAPLTVWPVVGAREFLIAIIPAGYDRRVIVDAGRCLQNVVLKATRMGLGTCWIGPGADHKSAMRHLDPSRFDAEKEHILCFCAIGYASRRMPLMVRVARRFSSLRRRPLRELFFDDGGFTPILSNNKPLDVTCEPFCHFKSCFEACRWAPSSFNAQPTRYVAVTTTKQNKTSGTTTRRLPQVLKRLDFYATGTSRWYTPLAVGIAMANWDAGCKELGIKGHFEYLDGRQKDCYNSKTGEYVLSSDRLHYDMSWVFDDKK